MINQLMPGSRQYYDFIDGFDSVKGKKWNKTHRQQ
jgi:hypothetical protein